jgi:hypothetical protein
LSLAVAAPTIARVEAARRAGTPMDAVAKGEIHAAWMMNAALYLAAGIAMLVIFRRPTTAQLDDART